VIAVSGTTRVAGLLGFPATYSLSPALHNAAYEAMGFDATYVVFPTQPQHLVAAVEAVRALNLLGVSVTIPHKEAVVALCDELTVQAQQLQAVNCISLVDGKLIGHNTDGDGFVRALDDELTFLPAGKRAVVVGGGGAARAVVDALTRHGATEVVVVNRSAERAKETAELAGDIGRVGDLADIPTADLVVNATPVGMVGDLEGQSPVPSDVFRSEQVVVDLIYKPARTQFLLDADAAGARVGNGLGMLLHQAALQIELWTGKSPSLDAMRAAVAHV
jgi:shikimate dehydrogenase